MKNRIDSELKKLKSSGELSSAEYKLLYVNTAVTPRFYSFIKTHKPNNPIRPIVSFIDSPTYQTAKFLNKILSPLTDDAPQKLKNSAEVNELLENVIIPSDHTLVSFDVRSLFTNIPRLG